MADRDALLALAERYSMQAADLADALIECGDTELAADSSAVCAHWFTIAAGLRARAAQ